MSCNSPGVQRWDTGELTAIFTINCSKCLFKRVLSKSKLKLRMNSTSSSQLIIKNSCNWCNFAKLVIVLLIVKQFSSI